jgi:hypothetical protein
MSKYDKGRDLREQSEDRYIADRRASKSELTPDEEYLKLCEKKYWNKGIKNKKKHI